jgi:rubrerythrin
LPEFSNPFSDRAPERTLTTQELIRAIRLDIAAEHEAVYLYMAHAEAIDHPLAKRVLIDVANEEREHIGEFQRLLDILTGDESEWMANGVAEVDEMAAELATSGSGAGGAPVAESAVADTGGESAGGATIGSLRDH